MKNEKIVISCNWYQQLVLAVQEMEEVIKFISEWEQPRQEDTAKAPKAENDANEQSN